MRRAALSLLLLAPLTACEPPPGASAFCVRSGECPAPLACLAGRCREQCESFRDCDYPLACVEASNDGLFACRVGEDAYCRGDEDCAFPLVCLDGACEQPCADHYQCAAGGSCVDGRCDQPAEVPTVGTCDPIAVVSGCTEAELCRLDTTTGAFACLPRSRDRLAVGAPCFDATTPCDDGLTCAGGRCVALCVPGQTSCGPSLLCTLDPTNIATATGYAAPPPEGLGYCTEACDPLAGDARGGCPEGTSCGLRFPPSRVATYCRGFSGTPIGSFEPCAEDGACPAAHTCGIDPLTSVRLCRPFCRVSDGPCANGGRCLPQQIPGRLEVGVCGDP